jgi:hypothetical protein
VLAIKTLASDLVDGHGPLDHLLERVFGVNSRKPAAAQHSPKIHIVEDSLHRCGESFRLARGHEKAILVGTPDEFREAPDG